MDGVDALLLARIQFAANMTFHILFPTISISLGWVLLFFKLRYVKTKNETATRTCESLIFPVAPPLSATSAGRNCLPWFVSAYSA